MSLSTITAAPLVDAENEVAPVPARKVVVLLADAPTQAALRDWAEAQGFDLGASYGGAPRDPAEFEYHLTLFATVEACDMPAGEASIEPLAVYPVGFDAFGDDRSTPVLLVDSDETLHELRAAWLDACGATPTYADFRPHVSLSYAWDGAPDLALLDLPDIAMRFDRLEVRDLEAVAAKSAAEIVAHMQRWKAAFDDLVPSPKPAERRLLARRLKQFACDLAQVADPDTVDREAFADLLREIEALSN